MYRVLISGAPKFEIRKYPYMYVAILKLKFAILVYWIYSKNQSQTINAKQFAWYWFC